MHQNHLPGIPGMYLLMNQDPFAVKFFSWGDVLDYGRHTKKPESVEASVKLKEKATDECVKSIQMFHHILTDLHLLNCSSTTNVYNDNHGAIDRTSTFSTKGMGHINIRENCVREVHVLNEVSQISKLDSKKSQTYIFPRLTLEKLIFELHFLQPNLYKAFLVKLDITC
jgi:hypothetical protein